MVVGQQSALRVTQDHNAALVAAARVLLAREVQRCRVMCMRCVTAALCVCACACQSIGAAVEESMNASLEYVEQQLATALLIGPHSECQRWCVRTCDRSGACCGTNAPICGRVKVYVRNAG
jgi:hypothetical protein